MTQIPNQLTTYSLRGQYDPQKVVAYLQKKIKQNIPYGKIMECFLSNFSTEMRKQACSELIKEYQELPFGNWSKSKLPFIQKLLQKYSQEKVVYDFAARNIAEANKFNQWYGEENGQKLIKDIPELRKNFLCDFCGQKRFLNNAALGSHKRTCPKRSQSESSTPTIKALVQQRPTKVRALKNRSQFFRIGSGNSQQQQIEEEEKFSVEMLKEQRKGLKRSKYIGNVIDIYEQQYEQDFSQSI